METKKENKNLAKGKTWQNLDMFFTKRGREGHFLIFGNTKNTNS